MSIFQKRQVHTLSEWLEIATRKLADASKDRIRLEIEAHYAEAVEAHCENGLSQSAAQAAALAELGDPEAAAKRFRKRHLTEREAKKLTQAYESARSILFPLFSYVFFWALTSGHVYGKVLSHLRDPLTYLALQSVFFIVSPTACFVLARLSNAKPNRNLLWLEALYFLGISCFLYVMISSANSPSVSVALNVVCSAIVSLPCLLHFLILLHLWRKVERLEKLSSHTLPPAPAQT